MSIGLDIPARPRHSNRLSESQVFALARTYDSVSSPVWVEAMDGSRIYQNPSAERGCWSADCPAVSFDIIDHLGRVVGRLGTIQN